MEEKKDNYQLQEENRIKKRKKKLTNTKNKYFNSLPIKELGL